MEIMKDTINYPFIKQNGNNERYYKLSIYLITPFQKHSVIQWTVCLIPMWPGIGSTWYALIICCLSSVLRMYRTSCTICVEQSLLLKVLNYVMLLSNKCKHLFSSRIFLGLHVEDFSTSQYQHCGLSLNYSLLITTATIRIAMFQEVGTRSFMRLSSSGMTKSSLFRTC